MPATGELLFGEYSRTLDERFRLTLPSEILEPLVGSASQAVLAKERLGCLSLWRADQHTEQLTANVDLLASKLRSGKLAGRWDEVQRLGRLLSTRYRPVELMGRGRLLIPETFRGLLGVQPNNPLVVVGAGICLEIWNPDSWLRYIEAEMPSYRTAFDQLTS